MVDGKEYSATIKHTKCELLIDGNLFASCNSFRNFLRALFSKHKNRADTLSLFTNTRFLRTPQKSARIMSLQKAIRIKNRQLKQLKIRVVFPNKSSLLFLDIATQQVVFPLGTYKKLGISFFWH